MAALRISVPGQPTELVDLGPGVGRTTHTRGKVYGGVLVVAESERSREKRMQREAMTRLRRGSRYMMTDPDNGGVKPIQYRGPR